MNVNRDVVLTTAAELADEGGFESISVSALARRLGVQPASIYSHVRDRADVLDGVQERALEELSAQISDAIAGRSGKDALVGLAEAHRTFARERPGRWTAVQRPPTTATAHSAAARRLVMLIDAVLRGYPISHSEMVHATRFIAGTINGFLALERAEAFSQREPATETSWLRALDVLHVALTRWPAENSEETP